MKMEEKLGAIISNACNYSIVPHRNDQDSDAIIGDTMLSDAKFKTLTRRKDMKSFWRQTLLSVFLIISCFSSSAISLCPNQCKCNESILKTTCSSSSLNTIPITLNPRLKELYLNENRIRSLSASTLSFYFHLEILSLSSNKIVKLENVPRSSADQQNHLDANSNIDSTHHLSKAPPTSLFHALNHLQILFLDNNSIETLTGNATFLGLDNLIILNLAANRLEKIHACAFLGLNKLEELDLSGNQISSIEDGAFFGMANLKVLSLRGNKMAEFLTDAQLVGVSSSLTKLDYGLNNLYNFGSVSLGDISTLEALQELKLDGANIKTFFSLGDAEDLPSLLSLDISSNAISYLSQESNLGLFHRLKCLNLGDNPLHCNCTLGWIKTLVFNVSVERKNSLKGANSDSVFSNFECEPSFDKILNLLCAGPEGVKNQTLLSVDFDDISVCLNEHFGATQLEESYLCVWLLLLLLSSVGTLILIYLKLIIFKPKYPKFCDPFTTLSFGEEVDHFNTQLRYAPSSEWHLDYTPNYGTTPSDELLSGEALTGSNQLIRITENAYHNIDTESASSTESSAIDENSSPSPPNGNISNGNISNANISNANGNIPNVKTTIAISKPPPLPTTPRPSQRLINHPMMLNRYQSIRNSNYGTSKNGVSSNRVSTNQYSEYQSSSNQMFAIAVKPNSRFPSVVNQIARVESQNVESQNVEGRNLESRNLEGRNVERWSVNQMAPNREGTSYHCNNKQYRDLLV